MGDMNVDLLKCATHGKTNEYLDHIFSSGYIPVITKPTRVCSSTATLIDHIYTNILKRPLLPAIVLTDVSDHFGICLFVPNKQQHKEIEKYTYRDYSDKNLYTFKASLNNTDFTTV